MQISTPRSEPPSCAVIGQLVDLLGDFPAGRDRGRAEMTAERLTQLEHEARRVGAGEATLATIKGARVLLELAELPPLPRPSR